MAMNGRICFFTSSVTEYLSDCIVINNRYGTFHLSGENSRTELVPTCSFGSTGLMRHHSNVECVITEPSSILNNVDISTFSGITVAGDGHILNREPSSNLGNIDISEVFPIPTCSGDHVAFYKRLPGVISRMRYYTTGNEPSGGDNQLCSNSIALSDIGDTPPESPKQGIDGNGLPSIERITRSTGPQCNVLTSSHSGDFGQAGTTRHSDMSTALPGTRQESSAFIRPIAKTSFETASVHNNERGVKGEKGNERGDSGVPTSHSWDVSQT